MRWSGHSMKGASLGTAGRDQCMPLEGPRTASCKAHARAISLPLKRSRSELHEKSLKALREL